MTIEDQSKDEKLRYNIGKELQKYQLYHPVKSISTSILPVRKYCHLINSKYLSKLDLLILPREKLLKNKQKQLKIKEKNK